jgi:hypothetical protein
LGKRQNALARSQDKSIWSTKKYLEQKQERAGFPLSKEVVLPWGQIKRRRRKMPCVQEYG